MTLLNDLLNMSSYSDKKDLPAILEKPEHWKAWMTFLLWTA